MFKHITAYFTSPEFDALRRAASTGQSERTEPTENSVARSEVEEVDEAILEEVN